MWPDHAARIHAHRRVDSEREKAWRAHFALAATSPEIVEGALYGMGNAGFMWGKYIHINRHVTAGCAVLIGLALVGLPLRWADE